MRILLLTQRVPYAPDRGDRIRAYYLIRALARHHEVHVAALAHSAKERAAAAEGIDNAASVLAAPIRPLRARLRAVRALVSGSPLTHALLDAPGFGKSVLSLVRGKKIDLIFAFCSSMVRYAMDEGLADLPVLFDMVDVDSEKWREVARRARAPLSALYRREARLLARFEHEAMRRAGITIVVNEREAELIRRSTPGCDVRAVPNGVDLSRFGPPEDSPESDRVVFTGVMNYAPNVEAARRLATSIWPNVREQVPAATLWIVGSDPTREVRALASAEHGIHVTGRVPEIEPYYRAAAVSALPLPWARGVQNKAIEAIASGLPCIAPSVVLDGLPDTILPACIPAETDEAFAREITRMLRMPGRERARIAAAANLDSLGWDRALGSLDSIVEECARACGGEAPSS